VRDAPIHPADILTKKKLFDGNNRGAVQAGMPMTAKKKPPRLIGSTGRTYFSCLNIPAQSA
jgi:hypothetical protein